MTAWGLDLCSVSKGTHRPSCFQSSQNGSEEWHAPILLAEQGDVNTLLDCRGSIAAPGFDCAVYDGVCSLLSASANLQNAS